LIGRNMSPTPAVPDQLTHYLEDPRIEKIIDKWQKNSLETVEKHMPETTVVDLGERAVRAAILAPEGADHETTLVMPLPFQQAWKPSMFIRAELTRRIVAPHSQMIIFPHAKEDYFLTKEERKSMRAGNVTPLVELEIRALEALEVGKIALTGYSLGAFLSINIAAHGSKDIDVASVNADESPSQLGRSAKQLQKAFLKSGGWGDQRAAMSDSAIPSINEALSVPRLAVDYAKFGLESVTRAESKAISGSMAGHVTKEIENILAHNDVGHIKLGHVEGSQLFDGNGYLPEDPRLTVKMYTGKAARMHSTGDNVVAHALMALDGLGVVSKDQ
jgi:hypothetical protein